MTAEEEILEFLAAMKAEGSAHGEHFEETMLKYARSDAPRDIETCDAICKVIRRKGLLVKERAKLIAPILQHYLDSFDQ